MTSVAKPSRRFAWIGRVVVILTLIVGVVVARRLWPERPLRIRAAAVSAGKVRDVVSSATAGEVAPENRATLRAELGGQVVAVSKRRGDRVSKSELIVRIDPTDLEVKLRQAQAAVSTAEAQVQQAAARVETIKRQSDRAQKLLAGGAGHRPGERGRSGGAPRSQSGVANGESQREQAQAQLLAARVARSTSGSGRTV
jgi:multidrug efflux pump subunit AcrA (membrane-fusion protein)